MKCPGCGNENPEAVEFCAECGHRMAGVRHLAAEPFTRREMKPKTIALIIVAIVVVSIIGVTVLYIHVLSFGNGPHTPYSSLTLTNLTYGQKFTFAPMTLETQWSEVTISLDDGSNTVRWTPETTGLDSGTTAWQYEDEETLGSLSVWCSITDITGNGYINSGDYFVLSVGEELFDPDVLYTCAILYEPTGGLSCSLSFSG